MPTPSFASLAALCAWWSKLPDTDMWAAIGGDVGHLANILDNVCQLEEDSVTADDILQSEAMLWLMSGANHAEAHLNVLRPAVQAYWDEHGSWSHPVEKASPSSPG